MRMLSLRGLGLAWAFAAVSGAPVAAETCQGAPSAAKLVINVTGVRSPRGLMTASLYADDPGQFLVKNGALKVWWGPAAVPATRLCIWLKSPGVYALAVYQDYDSSHHFAVGRLGPKEPYGFSRNPRILFSKPTLPAVRFLAKAGVTTLEIRLNNPL